MKNPLKDLWTNSCEYKDLYQSQKQIEEIIRILKLPSATALADIGCGNGIFSLEAAKRFSTLKVWAIDPLASAITKCSLQAKDWRLNNITAVIAFADSIPLPDFFLDRLLMRNVVHHVPNIESVFAEMNRLLKPDGLFLLEGPCNPGDDATGELISEIHIIMDDSHRRTYYRSDDITCKLRSADISVQSTDFWQYPFMINKAQANLIKKHQAEQLLSLEKVCDNEWKIHLTLMRIVGKKC